MDIIAILCEEFEVSTAIAKRVVELIDEGNTIPFIARYRKELYTAEARESYQGDLYVPYDLEVIEL